MLSCVLHTLSLKRVEEDFSMLALMKIVDGEKVFVSASDPHEATDDFDKALRFFSENHIYVWRQLNPDIKNTIAVDVIYKNGDIRIQNVEDKIIGW